MSHAAWQPAAHTEYAAVREPAQHAEYAAVADAPAEYAAEYEAEAG
jgi:hypothetical protein